MSPNALVTLEESPFRGSGASTARLIFPASESPMTSLSLLAEKQMTRILEWGENQQIHKEA